MTVRDPGGHGAAEPDTARHSTAQHQSLAALSVSKPEQLPIQLESGLITEWVVGSAFRAVLAGAVQPGEHRGFHRTGQALPVVAWDQGANPPGDGPDRLADDFGAYALHRCQIALR